jgi:chorismate mutase
MSLIEKQISVYVHGTRTFVLWEYKEVMMKMEGKSAYFVVRERALPEVLLKVVEVNRLLETQKVSSVQEAVERVGISRSSYYKYKEDIFPFHDSSKGTTLTLSCRMDDEPGLLSDVLKVVADFRANILTIHQSIPINGIATLSLSIQILDNTGDVSEMVSEIEKKNGVHNVKVLGRD